MSTTKSKKCKAATKCPIKLGDAAGHAGRQRDISIQPNQLDRLTAALQIMPRTEGRNNGRSVLGNCVPFIAIYALPGPFR